MCVGTRADAKRQHATLSAEAITNTINLNSTTLMQLRARFAHEIEPVFAVNTALIRTHASVIQDASIRVFYALVAEAMGSAYADFAERTVLTLIPSTNCVAVLWLLGVQANPLIGKVRQDMRNINLRESPYAISLGDCQSSARCVLLWRVQGRGRERTAVRCELTPLVVSGR